MNPKKTEEEKKKMLDDAVKEMEKEGYRVLSPEEHRKLVSGKKIVFSEQAIEDIGRMVDK